MKYKRNLILATILVLVMGAFIFHFSELFGNVSAQGTALTISTMAQSNWTFQSGSSSLTASNSIADSGQFETLTAAVLNGTGPFTYTFYNLTDGLAQPIADCSGIAANTCTFQTNSTGIFSFNATATGPNGSINSNAVQVIVNQQIYPPTIDLISINQNGSATFMINVSGGTSPLRYSWNLTNYTAASGCGSAYGQNQTCTVFENTGSTGPYSLTANVTDSATTPMVMPDWHLVVTIAPKYALVSSGQTVSFTANVIPHPSGKPLLKYAWTSNMPLFSNTICNTKTTNTAVTCMLTAPAVTENSSYYVRAIVSNSAYGEFYANAILTVTPALATSLNANWTYISAGQSVYFTNTTTGGTGGNQYSYNYECGGVTQNGNVFTFANQGACAITLNVIDSSGGTGNSTNTITVTAPLQITSFTNVSSAFINTGQSVSFANTTTGGTGSDAWAYFVDGTGAAPNANGSVSFPNTGTYTVTLGVIDATGEISNWTDGIQVTVSSSQASGGSGGTGGGGGGSGGTGGFPCYPYPACATTSISTTTVNTTSSTTTIIPQNAPIQKAPSTTTTTVPASTTIAQTAPALTSTSSNNDYLIAAIIAIIAVVLSSMYLFAKNRGKRKGR